MVQVSDGPVQTDNTPSAPGGRRGDGVPL